MDERDLIYAAGIIDGEGWVGIRRKKGKRNKTRPYSYAIGVSVGMANDIIPQWLCLKFGGSVHSRTPENRHKVWQWQIEHKLAMLFLGAITPYLKLKIPQAKLAIEFQRNIKARQYKYNPKTEGELAVEEAQAILMHSLNSFGAS